MCRRPGARRRRWRTAVGGRRRRTGGCGCGAEKNYNDRYAKEAPGIGSADDGDESGTVDARYFLTEKVALGFVYWYDRYDVQDFALGNERISLNDLPGGILLGYLYRPYTAHSGWLRLTVYW